MRTVILLHTPQNFGKVEEPVTSAIN